MPLVHARIRAADRWFDSCHGTFWNLTIFTLAQVCTFHGPKTINFGKTHGLISWQRTKPEKILVSRQSLQSKIVAMDLVVGFTEGPYHRLVGQPSMRELDLFFILTSNSFFTAISRFCKGANKISILIIAVHFIRSRIKKFFCVSTQT